MPKGEESMQSYSGLQKLVALTIITLVALFIAAKFTHGDANGTATGGASDAATFSGNGGTALPLPHRPPEPETPPPASGAPGLAWVGHDPAAGARDRRHTPTGL